jgi:cytosine/adenosine deaminase-related metal-dependent hydrolase
MTSRFFFAPWLFPGDGPPVRDGWIELRGDRIAATGFGEIPAGTGLNGVRRFDGCALMPGLVNAHCHLELTTLHDRLDRGKPFPVWVEQLRGHTAGLGPADYRQAAREGVRRLLAGGCTAVLDVGNAGEALNVLAEGPLRALALVETLGLDPALATPRAGTAEAIATRLSPKESFRPGTTPHAAYSCSPDLLRRVIEAQRARGLPVTLHAAESREEAELFASGTGPLAEYCRHVFDGAPRHADTTSIRWLESLGLLPDGAIIAHGNVLDSGDMEILARRGARVVHCPSSHAFFGHPRFPCEELRAHGIPVCLGTDSLASGDSLSMLEQVRLFRAVRPEVPVWEILAMASATGAQALGLKDTGLLRSGFLADFVAVRAEDPETLFENAPRVEHVVIGGAEARLIDELSAV